MRPAAASKFTMIWAELRGAGSIFAHALAAMHTEDHGNACASAATSAAALSNAGCAYRNSASAHMTNAACVGLRPLTRPATSWHSSSHSAAPGKCPIFAKLHMSTDSWSAEWRVAHLPRIAFDAARSSSEGASAPGACRSALDQRMRTVLPMSSDDATIPTSPCRSGVPSGRSKAHALCCKRQKSSFAAAPAWASDDSARIASAMFSSSAVERSAAARASVARRMMPTRRSHVATVAARKSMHSSLLDTFDSGDGDVASKRSAM
mmetsp:Transcript_10246/g.42505  ORF Transcript_10246/g.42505 Transcript_10246/m.42505 type:complete len:264 (+) Transcript_10246:3037-3828(+)